MLRLLFANDVNLLQAVVRPVEQEATQGYLLALVFRAAVPVVDVVTRLMDQASVIGKPEDQGTRVTAGGTFPLIGNQNIVNRPFEPLAGIVRWQGINTAFQPRNDETLVVNQRKLCFRPANGLQPKQATKADDLLRLAEPSKLVGIPKQGYPTPGPDIIMQGWSHQLHLCFFQVKQIPLDGNLGFVSCQPSLVKLLGK